MHFAFLFSLHIYRCLGIEEDTSNEQMRQRRNVEKNGVISDKASWNFNDGTTGFYSMKQLQGISE